MTTITYKIGLSDVGKGNKMSNKSIIKVLENAGGVESEKVGYGFNEIPITHLSWVLLAWKVKVIKRPIYNEEIKITTWAREANKVFTYRDFEIYNEKGEICAIATSKWTFINIQTLKLAPISEDVINSYEFFNKSVFENGQTEKLKEPTTLISKINYKVLRSQIDVNNHMHNLCYLDLAYEALPEDEYYKDEANNIDIMYKKQIKLEDKIICNYTKENNQNIVTIKSDDEKTLHAIIRLY